MPLHVRTPSQRPHSTRRAWPVWLLFALIFTARMAAATDCASAERWVAEAQSWSMGKDLSRIYIGQTRELIGPVFHDEIMSQIWGEPYRSMSANRRAEIHKALTHCGLPDWARVGMVTPFSNPPDAVKTTRGTDYQLWQATIESVNRFPWAAWQAKKQQLVGMLRQREQQRADWVARAPEREQLAREMAAARQREKDAQVRRVEQETADREALVAKHRNNGPFSGSNGAAYLNALYHNDRQALQAYDQMFAAGFSSISNVYGSKDAQAMLTLLGGKEEAERLANITKRVTPHLSLIVPVAVSFVVYYERAYPQCMDKDPQIFERNTEYEWVERNGFGQVMRNSPAWTHTDRFRINNRFMGVWAHRGSIEQNETQIADFLFGKSGAIRAYDAMLAANLAMHKFACDSEEIKTLETNMLRYFNDRIEQVQRAVRE